MWLWAVGVATAMAGIPHQKVEHGATHQLMRRLDIRTAKAREPPVKPRNATALAKKARGAQALDDTGVLLPGQFQGLRIAVVDSWLDDAAHTCQEPSPRGARFSDNRMDPRAYYRTQPRASITVLNRDSDSPRTHEIRCDQKYILTKSQKSMLRTRVIPRLNKHLSALLAPKRRGTGVIGAPIGANDATSLPECDDNKCFKCLQNPHLVFPLPHPYAFAGADLLILLTAEPDHQPAAATPCSFATDDRPNVIVLNVAPNKLHAVANVPRGEDKLHAWLLQAALHALGFEPNLFFSWKVTRPSDAVPNPTGKGGLVHMVRTPEVVDWLNTEQFLCTGHPKGGSGTIDGAELEDALGDAALGFWEKRLFRGDVLTKLPDLEFDQSDEVAVVSGLTLAVFDDMGFYTTNRQLAQPLKWLHEEPCSTASSPCTEWSPRYVCARGEAVPKCSADYTAVASCTGFDWWAAASYEIPAKFQVDTAVVHWGGQDPLMDFCPTRAAPRYGSCLTAWPADGDCQNERCANFQVRGEDSRCFASTLHYPAFAGAGVDQGRCIPHRCVAAGTPGTGELQQYNLVLSIAGQEYTCDGSFAEVGPGSAGVQTCGGDVLKGLVTCPDAAARRALCETVGVDLLKASCDPFVDCNGRGSCNADGTCSCFTSLDSSDPPKPLYGMFAGAHCEHCLEGYYGPDCRQASCPLDPETGSMCYGNGQCVDGACMCYGNATAGYWDPATSCSTCLGGWTGGSCKLAECSTEEIGSCRKGTCVAKTRRCSCFENDAQGYWMVGSTGLCDRCRPGYDIHQSCKVRIRNYYGCDGTLGQGADLAGIWCDVACPAGGAVPQRVPERDDHGCAFDYDPPRCAGQRAHSCAISKEPRDGAIDGCPNPSIVTYDCKGYPNLYHDCWMVNECGCFAPRRPECITGTDAVPSPDAYDPAARAKDVFGSRDSRTADKIETTSEKTCRCPAPAYRPFINCWGSTASDPAYPGGVQPKVVDGRYERGHVVFHQPEQVYEEDFCHCTSPPIPTCSDETRPEWLLQKSAGTRLTCSKILSDFGCPDWNWLLNIGGVRNLTGPDLSLIDCDGWPAPKLKQHKDPCGCPFPQFKCIEGTMGVCGDPPECPAWDPLPPIDCLGQMPPVVSLHAPHPCGCPPPPTPTCIPGTERQACDCDAVNGVMSNSGSANGQCLTRDVVWVDCRNTPLEQPGWTPYQVYPAGDPFLNTCDPCPQCAPKLPVRRCLPQTSAPTPRLDNKVENHCPALNTTNCQVRAPACAVDCEGKPRVPGMQPGTAPVSFTGHTSGGDGSSRDGPLLLTRAKDRPPMQLQRRHTTFSAWRKVIISHKLGHVYPAPISDFAD